MKYDMEKVLRERKTDRQGIRFKPSIVKMLKEIAKHKNLSMADCYEILVIDEYKRIFVNEKN